MQDPIELRGEDVPHRVDEHTWAKVNVEWMNGSVEGHLALVWWACPCGACKKTEHEFGLVE